MHKPNIYVYICIKCDLNVGFDYKGIERREWSCEVELNQLRG